MLVRISSIKVHPTSLLIAILYGIFGCVEGLFFIIPALLFSHPMQAQFSRTVPMLMGLAMPFVFFAVTYAGTALGILLYNAIAPRIGGVVFRCDVLEGSAQPPSPA